MIYNPPQNVKRSTEVFLISSQFLQATSLAGLRLGQSEESKGIKGNLLQTLRPPRETLPLIQEPYPTGRLSMAASVQLIGVYLYEEENVVAEGKYCCLLRLQHRYYY